MNFINNILLRDDLRRILITDNKINHSANLYLDIISYESEKTFLSHVNIIYQKYLELGALYSIDIPLEHINKLHNLLWKDEDGSDTNNLIIPKIFNNVKTWCYNLLYNYVDNKYDNSIVKAIIHKFMSRTQRRSRGSMKESISPMEKWLCHLKLEHLVDVFINNDIVEEDIMELTDNYLKNIGILTKDIQNIMSNIK
jgi:hypothetical protein